MQLVAYGAQDAYLTGDPEITFFKASYKRHTNFAVEPIEQILNGNVDFGKTPSCNLNRNGDLIKSMYFVVVLAAKTGTNWGYVRRLGHALLQSFKIEVGGTKVDEHYGDWLNIVYELSRNTGHERGYAAMIGDVNSLKTIGGDKSAYTLYVPMQFWFNKNNGLALPLIALQYHDVRVSLTLREAAKCVNHTGSSVTNPPSMQNAYLLIDYVFLDQQERKKFAQAKHEYLIQQLQHTGSESIPSINNKYRLNFNHPTRYLVWAFHLERYNSGRQYAVWATDGDWNAALATFAKRVWLAAHLNDAGVLEISDAAAGSGADSSFYDVVTPTNKSSGVLLALSSKVNAMLVFQSDVSGSTVSATEANVTVLSHTLTVEDMATTMANLTAGASVGGAAHLNDNAVAVYDYANYGANVDGTGNPCGSVKLQLNGHDRFTQRDGNYFNYVQPFQHFNNTPADGINVYSFALEPEKHQPSGSCNFSRIDNTTLHVTVGDGTNTYFDNVVGGSSSSSVMDVYGWNDNVFRVMSGMGGLGYSN